MSVSPVISRSAGCAKKNTKGAKKNEPTIITIEEDLEDAAIKCQEALAHEQFSELNTLLPGAPPDAEGWFELLSDYPHNSTRLDILKKMDSALPEKATASGVQMGHYAALSALPCALIRIKKHVLPDAVMHYYADFCRAIAAREKHLEILYDMTDEPLPFQDLTEIATLKQFPLGDFSFGYGKMPLVAISSSIHPMSLPGFLCEAICAMKGGRLTIFPHISFAKKSLILRRGDYEKALWLMAKTLELRPELKGFCSLSWLHSSIVGTEFPHLSWIRDAFIEAGAYVVETRPAHLGRYGFGYKDPKRTKLYEEGKFCPRQTMALWPRTDFLEWAAKHPELKPEGEEPISLPATSRLRIKISPAKPVSQTKRNSPLTLWDGHELYKRIGKLKYAILVFLLPALGVASIAALTLGWLAALPGFLIGIAAAHAFQYFFSQ